MYPTYKFKVQYAQNINQHKQVTLHLVYKFLPSVALTVETVFS